MSAILPQSAYRIRGAVWSSRDFVDSRLGYFYEWRESDVCKVQCWQSQADLPVHRGPPEPIQA